MRLAILACTLAALTACGTLEAPALDALHDARPPEQPPLIVIPGLLASHLADARTGRRVWPPNLLMLVGGWRMRDIAVPLPYQTGAARRELDATGIVLSRPRRDYYSSLLDSLAAVGYDCVPRHEVAADTSCVLFSWDWRRGFVSAAAGLDALVNELRALRGDPALEVDILAHSAGAMVARYFARFGSVDVLERDASGAIADDAAPGVRRSVLIGPPNLGSVFGAQRLVRGYRLGVFTVQPEVLATFESTYQLLPHPGRRWLINVHGEHVARDLYDPDTWRDFEISIFDPEVRARAGSRFDSTDRADRHLQALEARFERGLARARRFHEAIADLPSAAEPEYLVLGSNCEPTPRRLLTETVDGRSVLRLWPDEVAGRVPGVDYGALMLEPGDGRVTRESLVSVSYPAGNTRPAPPQHDFAFFCERHSEMTSNTALQRAAFEFLLN